MFLAEATAQQIDSVEDIVHDEQAPEEPDGSVVEDALRPDEVDEGLKAAVSVFTQQSRDVHGNGHREEVPGQERNEQLVGLSFQETPIILIGAEEESGEEEIEGHTEHAHGISQWVVLQIETTHDMCQDYQKDAETLGQIDELYSFFCFSRHDACKVSGFFTICKKYGVSLCG